MKQKAINQYPLGQYILDKLKEKGMSQAELSSITRFSTPVINDIVKGRRSISAKQIVRIAILLGLDAIEVGRMQSDYEIIQVIKPLMEEDDESGNS